MTTWLLKQFACKPVCAIAQPNHWKSRRPSSDVSLFKVLLARRPRQEAMMKEKSQDTEIRDRRSLVKLGKLVQSTGVNFI